MLHKLRIVFSAACVLGTVLLIALWVRSYRNADTLGWHNGWGVSFSSFAGRIELCLNSGKTDFPDMQRGVSYDAYPDLQWSWPEQQGCAKYGFHSSPGGSPGIHFLQVPHWFPALLTGLATVAPWIHWRFRLRTLLIAISLFAVVLGILAITI